MWVNRERIRQIEAKALRKLRHPLALAEVAGVYGWGQRLARNMWGRPPSAVRFSPRRHRVTEEDRNKEWGTASGVLFFFLDSLLSRTMIEDAGGG